MMKKPYTYDSFDPVYCNILLLPTGVEFIVAALVVSQGKQFQMPRNAWRNMLYHASKFSSYFYSFHCTYVLVWIICIIFAQKRRLCLVCTKPEDATGHLIVITISATKQLRSRQLVNPQFLTKCDIGTKFKLA